MKSVINNKNIKSIINRLVGDDQPIEHGENLPKVSIITPSYNQAQFLERTILSVLNQNYPNLEYIIVDGGSSDGSIEIIKKYENYIAYWISESDQGQSDALNKGFDKATGDIFGWLNSDDLLCPGAINSVVEAFLRNPEKLVVFGDYFFIDEDDNVTSINYAFDFNLNQFIYEGFHLNAQATFWKSSLHKKFGGFDISLQRTMDYEMLLKFGLIARPKYFLRIPYALACFRRHSDQKTKGFDERVLYEQQYIAKKNGIKYKFTFWGQIIRFFYRFRRLYWYIKRGGFIYAVKVFLNSI